MLARNKSRMRALVQGEAHHELKALNFSQIAPNSSQSDNAKSTTCDHDWRSNSFASWRSLRKSGVTSCVLLSARHASTVSCYVVYVDVQGHTGSTQSEREQEVNYRTIRIINSYSTCTLIPTRLQLYTSCTDCVFSSLLTCCRVSLISLSLSSLSLLSLSLSLTSAVAPGTQ